MPLHSDKVIVRSFDHSIIIATCSAKGGGCVFVERESSRLSCRTGIIKGQEQCPLSSLANHMYHRQAWTPLRRIHDQLTVVRRRRSNSLRWSPFPLLPSLNQSLLSRFTRSHGRKINSSHVVSERLGLTSGRGYIALLTYTSSASFAHPY